MVRNFVPGSTTSLPSIFDRSVPRIPISVVFMHLPLGGSVGAVNSVVADMNCSIRAAARMGRSCCSMVPSTVAVRISNPLRTFCGQPSYT